MNRMTDMSTMQRKARPPDKAVRPVAPSPARLWRRAAVHGLSKTAGLAARIEEVEFRAATPEDLAGMVDAGTMIALLEGPAGFALALLDAEGLAALIEAQTMGRVLRRPLDGRSPSGIDAAMIADPLDRVLDAHDRLLTELAGPAAAPARGAAISDGSDVPGYRYATHLTQSRQIAVALADAPHVLVTIALEFGEGARRGTLHLAFPDAPDAEAAVASGDWHARMEASVMQAEVPLRAVLARVRKPIHEVTGLAVGDLLVLPRTALDHVKMTAAGGVTVVEARLGRSGPSKAVRLFPAHPPGRHAFDTTGPTALPPRDAGTAAEP